MNNYFNRQTGAVISPVDFLKLTQNRNEWELTDQEVTHQVDTVVFPKECQVSVTGGIMTVTDLGNDSEAEALKADFPGFTEPEPSDNIELPEEPTAPALPEVEAPVIEDTTGPESLPETEEQTADTDLGGGDTGGAGAGGDY